MRTSILLALITSSVLILSCVKEAAVMEEVSLNAETDRLVTDTLESAFKDPSAPYDLDFSRVGYHYGDTEIPSIPVGKAVCIEDISAALSAGAFKDTTSFLQNAIDNTPSGTALLLKAGEYHISSSLSILRSNFVLRGEGWDKTFIISSNRDSTTTVILVGAAFKGLYDPASFTSIIDSHVPVGAMYVDVENPSGFNPGDRVFVCRPGTKEWIHDIRMDQIDDKVHPSWLPEDFNMRCQRIVTAVSGTRIWLDNPVSMSMDEKYGGGYLLKAQDEPVTEVGLEDFSIRTTYDPSVRCTASVTVGGVKRTIEYDCDENHAGSGIAFRYVSHGWARGVEGKHFRYATVHLANGAKQITVDGCRSLEPVSLIDGSRRYASVMSLATACLVKNCTAEKDRHMFVSSSRSDGPNVYLDCKATECYSNAGPHCYWASLFLYDNVEVDSRFSVEDTGGEAVYSSHGWQGANHVLWNCTAPEFVCQNPWATGRNWAWGCVGIKCWGSYFNESPSGKDPADWMKGDKWRLDGEWNPAIAGGESNTTKVSPVSLYKSQLAARHAAGIYLWK